MGKAATSTRESRLTPRQRTYFRALEKESDRGCVLVAAALLDDLTKELVVLALSPKVPQTKKFLADMLRRGPLSQSWARNQMLFITDTIEEDIFEDLEAIRRLRNDFAHGFRSVKFTEPEVQKKIFGLRVIDRIAAEQPPRTRSAKSRSPRSRTRRQEPTRIVFEFAASYLGGWLEGHIDGFIDGHARGVAHASAGAAQADGEGGGL